MDRVDAAVKRVQEGDFRSLDAIVDDLRSRNPQRRRWAAYGCRQVGSPATIDPLSKMATRDPSAENRTGALYALLGIGRPAVVPALLAGLRDEDAGPRTAARMALYRMLGRALLRLLSDEDESGEHDPQEARRIADWWSKHGSRFDPQLVYAFGQPAGPGVFIRQAKASKVRPATAMLNALREWTGQDFGAEKSVIMKWERWWAKNRAKYKPGRRYFYGHEVPSK